MKFLLKTFLITFTLIQVAEAGRMYDPEIGRFISRDPLGYVDGPSLYNAYFAEGFNVDPMGYNSRIVKHPLKLINSWSEVKNEPARKLTAFKKLQLQNNGVSTRGQSGDTAHYLMFLEYTSEGCPSGCAKVRLKDDKWDDVEIWGYVINQFRNERGDPQNRPNRIRTTQQHEQQHMDIIEKMYKHRQAIVKLFLTGKCEKRDKAKARGQLIETAWERIDRKAKFDNETLEVEDYKNDTTDQDNLRNQLNDANTALENSRQNHNQEFPNNIIESINFN